MSIGEFTVDFVKKLQVKNPKAKILLIWDGASYHRGEDLKKFLAWQNEGLYKALHGEAVWQSQRARACFQTRYILVKTRSQVGCINEPRRLE